jgi:hypothetical protein
LRMVLVWVRSGGPSTCTFTPGGRAFWRCVHARGDSRLPDVAFGGSAWFGGLALARGPGKTSTEARLAGTFHESASGATSRLRRPPLAARSPGDRVPNGTGPVRCSRIHRYQVERVLRSHLPRGTSPQNVSPRSKSPVGESRSGFHLRSTFR